jgi:predicted nucleic acid-binding Zn ribbon protein
MDWHGTFNAISSIWNWHTFAQFSAYGFLALIVFIVAMQFLAVRAERRELTAPHHDGPTSAVETLLKALGGPAVARAYDERKVKRAGSREPVLITEQQEAVVGNASVISGHLNRRSAMGLVSVVFAGIAFYLTDKRRSSIQSPDSTPAQSLATINKVIQTEIVNDPTANNVSFRRTLDPLRQPLHKISPSTPGYWRTVITLINLRTSSVPDPSKLKPTMTFNLDLERLPGNLIFKQGFTINLLGSGSLDDATFDNCIVSITTLKEPVFLTRVRFINCAFFLPTGDTLPLPARTIVRLLLAAPNIEDVTVSADTPHKGISAKRESAPSRLFRSHLGGSPFRKYSRGVRNC